MHFMYLSQEPFAKALTANLAVRTTGPLWCLSLVVIFDTQKQQLSRDS